MRTEISEALKRLPDVETALNRGWQFNVYERVRGGYYISLGPINNRPLALATSEDEDAAELIVAVLREAFPVIARD